MLQSNFKWHYAYISAIHFWKKNLKFYLGLLSYLAYSLSQMIHVAELPFQADCLAQWSALRLSWHFLDLW